MPLLPHLRAALVLLLWLVLLVLGTPGFDFVGAHELEKPTDRARYRDKWGEPLSTLAIAATDFNRGVRLPIAKLLTPVQRPFRVSQNWALYRDGPPRFRRFEVWVDDELRHRSADPEHDWLADALRSRRIRPVVESTCTAEEGANWRGLARYVVSRAREEWPAAARVDLMCTAARFPGNDPVVDKHYAASAPDWAAAPVEP